MQTASLRPLVSASRIPFACTRAKSSTTTRKSNSIPKRVNDGAPVPEPTATVTATAATTPASPSPPPSAVVIEETVATAPAAANTTTPRAPSIPWSEYLRIRNNKRKWELAVTYPSALVGLMGGASYFAGLETDPTKMIMGIDPFFFYGGCTMGTTVLGGLIGPSIGAAIWRLLHRQQIQLLDARDREFYARIVKNRVDATLQSPTNPIPDYYGEKVGSLAQYRHWLRDQSKYRKKMTLPESPEDL